MTVTNGHIKFMRGYDMEIHKHPNAFNLLAIIAQRAKRTESFNNKNLQIGEALLGDCKEYGMTRGQYRFATKLLVNRHFVTIRTTNKGTIVKLVNTSIFDINADETTINNTTTTTIKQPLTKNDKNEQEAAALIFLKKHFSVNGREFKEAGGSIHVKAGNKFSLIRNPEEYARKIKEAEQVSFPAEKKVSEMTDDELKDCYKNKTIGVDEGISIDVMLEATKRGLL